MRDEKGPGTGPELTDEELDGQHGSALPEKTAMSTITVSIGLPVGNFAMPINLASALNTASPDSWAIADADQVVVIDQVDDDTHGGPGRG
jgi:hypothetical protein